MPNHEKTCQTLVFNISTPQLPESFMDPLLTAISTHLGFLGYTTPPVPELPPNVEVVNAVHPLKPPFWVLPLHGGAFFRGIYVTTTNAQQDPAGFLNFINEVNAIM